MKKICIIGGGLGGLISAILLARKDFDVTLFEKKEYPFHRVCGEYISNEVKSFLEREGIYPEEFSPSDISQFLYTSTKGNTHQMPLDLGAFGISRYHLDQFLAEKAIDSGAQIKTNTTISEIIFDKDEFHLKDQKGKNYHSDYIIGAYGKQSVIDKKLNRSFIQKRNPYIGVKYHIKTEFPKDLIALHNFESGYCGISAIENDLFNLCYLGNRNVLRKYGSIAEMEENVLYQNPFLKEIFTNSDFVFDKPEVINEFSFAPKTAVDQHVLMVGDAAGLITPLCGNGMAMAIHSAKIASDMLQFGLSRTETEKAYSQKWTKTFAKRLWIGRQAQKLFGTPRSSELAVKIMKNSPFIAKKIMANTHGQPF